MPIPFRSLALGIALAAALVSSSCSKKPQELPAPATPPAPTGPGIIVGRVQPVDALFAVRLIDYPTKQTLVSARVDSQTGVYRFDAVPAGVYLFRFDTYQGYVQPREQTVTVQPGVTTEVPTVSPVRSTAAFTANGVAVVPTLVWTTIGINSFSLNLTDEVPFAPVPRAATYRLQLTMPYSVQVGTYQLNSTLLFATFLDGSGQFDSRLPPLSTPTGGTLTITAIENIAPFPRSISGTFSFSGTDATTGAQKTISGTFTNATF